uniref:Uncharacterized protein n=1 Tax=Oryza sativa subsp. japonica TaxID=39947 RepID=Q6K255_ORYSJ|nr:hypothetical protein [Oryza sativa Japonica Group]BAD26126.1 hypothetical protein [Oryza sativa Japonica Group]
MMVGMAVMEAGALLTVIGKPSGTSTWKVEIRWAKISSAEPLVRPTLGPHLSPPTFFSSLQVGPYGG